MSQPSCFYIQYWRIYGSFLSNKSKWNKIQSSFIVHHINYYNFFNFQWNNIPLQWLSTASSTGHFDYSYTLIHQLIVEDFVVEIHHGHLHFFKRAFCFLFYRSYKLCTSYFENLKKTGFFPVISCVSNLFYYLNFPEHREILW